jgi:thymidylate synthase
VTYRNVVEAFIGELAEVRARGEYVSVRGRNTQELLGRSIKLERPWERCVTVPGRRNDIVATIAETMWVLAGRNDLDFLSLYLPRAIDFSDDGETWRGAYGPRLRDWNGVDQLSEVLRILRSEPHSRQGVMTLFDPDRDFVASRDIPCNNWLHFLVRDGRLEMFVTIRSNDAWWGFSGINTFEWSILQTLMAHWLGVDIGSVTFFVSSFHLYSEFFEKADLVLRDMPRNGYDAGWTPAPVSVPFEKLDEVLRSWFHLEELLRAGEDPINEIEAFPDPLFREFLWAVRVGLGAKRGASEHELRRLLIPLRTSDIGFALEEQLFRTSRTLVAPS